MSSHGLRIAFFGASLVSAWWNGAAMYYRGLLRALHARGHRITFYEPALPERQRHRDLPVAPDFATVVMYSAEGTQGLERCLEDARSADVVVKASGVGIFDEWLNARVLELKSGTTQVVYWDLDAPVTLERMAANPEDPFLALVPGYDRVFTQGGGDAVVLAYRDFGARECIPVYSAVDPDAHHPVGPEPRFDCDLVFMDDRLPDLERRVESYFMRAADLLPDKRFLLGGDGWGARSRPANMGYLGPVPLREHNAVRVSARSVLDVSRDGMARFGFSPAPRLLEAAAAGACLITDAWEGIELFLEPGRECLVAQDGLEVAEAVLCLTDEGVRQLGEAARRRVLAEHTYAHRALLVEQALGHVPGPGAMRASVA
ncbi:glycosyltransferase [Archangium violaceum]|uniref:CgeB family protein n=1 Tax=Archangium violaceum TaxID=83451 RepID=UPI00193C39F7|nr:glycosyltransferase [Archangium violaceum]QRK09372.1 glycosyltransferase [Archangium violaceum]